MIKIEQVELFKEALGKGSAEVAALFAANDVFAFIDDAYEMLHVQGALATYEDINAYIQNRNAA
jgi:hypothetical protein